MLEYVFFCFQDDFDKDSVVHVMQTLVSVAYREVSILGYKAKFVYSLGK